jgi:ABC-type transport system substrate-binding protein
LTDGTEIIVPEDMQTIVGPGFETGLYIERDGPWTLGAGSGSGYFYLKLPEWDTPQKYWVIRFEPYWGKFIDGKVYEGKY